MGDSSINCGGSSGKVCAVEFEGPGEKELPSPYKSGTTVEVRTIAGTTATVRVEDEDIELVEGAAPM